jgi:hypothetical protein
MSLFQLPPIQLQLQKIHHRVAGTLHKEVQGRL